MTERSNERVLVTGGAGFIGSHTVDRLMAAGDRVVVVTEAYHLPRSLAVSRPHFPVVHGSSAPTPTKQAVKYALREVASWAVHLWLKQRGAS